jgi:hypothetical protein
MADNRKLGRFVAGVVAVALLAAAQPPGSTAPPAPPTVSPTAELPRLPPPATAPDTLPPLTPPVVSNGSGSAPAPFPPPGGTSGPPPQFVQPPMMQGRPGPRFDLKIDPKATAKELLPPAPKVSPIRGPVTTDDLKAIPEIDFAAHPEKGATHEKLMGVAARQIAKINHVNAKKTDAFMAALLENRPDLAGLPFVMGDDCRTSGDKLKYFTQAAQTVRHALSAPVLPNAPPQPAQPAPARFSAPAQFVSTQPATGSVTLGNFMAQSADAIQEISFMLQPFWKRYTEACDQEDANRGRTDKETAEHIAVARVSALTQMLAAEPAETRLGLVKYLAGVPHVEATKALARMAIFSAENDVRDAAITALKVRREKDYTQVLVKGLNYPWPAVAKRSADAISKLERTDLIPELLNALDATDPRLPVVKEEGGKKVASVREMVKMNHHRNCLMCHAPNGSGTPNPNALTVEVAVQGGPLPSPSEGGYRQSTPELMIRLDVTYLRQDFSATMPVAEAHPWPEAQRFDFFVRERKLTAEETETYRDKLTPKEEGVLSPYHKAVLAALREMTGKDAAPTATAWRKLLNAPR